MSFRPLTDFVALDLETTGLDFATEEILELGGVVFANGVPSRTFSAVLRTNRPVTSFIEALTGISQAQSTEGREPVEALTEFAAFCGDLPVVAHNSHFDLKFLRKAWDAAGIAEPQRAVFDTLLGARISWPHWPSHKLESLVERLELPAQAAAHRALDDARSAGSLFLAIQDRLAQYASQDPAVIASLSWVLQGSESPWEALLPWDGGEDAPEPAWPADPSEPIKSGPPREHVLEVSQIDRVFSKNGPLAKGRADWEPRPAQGQMAREIAQALSEEAFLLCEAGTGTGKSLAYLVPAAMWAVEARDRVVVSTATKTLQNQLIEREAPLVREVVPGARVEVLKGRSNYLCVRRFADHLADPHRLDRAEREAILPLIAWVRSTSTGDIEECHGFGRDRNAGLWGKLQSDGRAGIPPRHPLFRICFHQRARRRAEAAHVLVVNHALLLSDLALDFAILPTYERLVVDEAHHLADVAHDHLGRAVSLPRLRRLLHPMAETSDKRAGVLGALAANRNLPIEAIAMVDLAREELLSADRRLHRLFQKLGEKVGRRGEEQKLRLREGLAAETGVDPSAAMGAFESAIKSISELRKALSEWKEGEEKGFLADLASGEGALSEFRRDLQVLCDSPASGDVHWIEDWSNPIKLVLRGSPLDPGMILAKTLYPAMKTAVFTSATLAIRGRAEHLEMRTGLARVEREIHRVRHPSPFKLREQARVVAAGWLPKPGEKGWTDALVQTLREVVLPLGRRSLVLFTSERSLRDVREKLVGDYRSAGRLLLAQGVDGNREALLSMFRRTEGACLLGSDSFWEGVDLPGRDLELVVIARLPFPVPSDPLVSARSEEVESEGRPPFAECFLPEAWLKLRQGIGRLLRRSDDRGAILVLDSRVVRERYGSYLADAWDGGHRQAKTAEQAHRELKEWFDGPVEVVDSAEGQQAPADVESKGDA
ncbi:MAG: 3'-5' exoribonuclease [Fibrobacterota bacterium]|nr:MAG: 3'-5' exoribonuclease [Fibrobacterota bacterium]